MRRFSPLRACVTVASLHVAVVVVSITSLPASETGPAAKGAPAVEVRLGIDTVEARPGDVVHLPVRVRTTVPLHGIELAIDFDEERLKFLRLERLDTLDPAEPDAAPAPPDEGAFNNEDELVGNQRDEGWIYVEIEASSAEENLNIDVDSATTLLVLEFLVRPDARVGLATVEFAQVGTRSVDGEAVVLFDNRVILAGGVPADAGELLFEDGPAGGVKIIGEIGFFMRGDSNRDMERDISDPVFTLSFLFLGAEPLACEDSGDANDDGSLDVTDAIFTLSRLYLEPLPFPPPTEWGRDPTPDNLSCKSVSAP